MISGQYSPALVGDLSGVCWDDSNPMWDPTTQLGEGLEAFRHPSPTSWAKPPPRVMSLKRDCATDLLVTAGGPPGMQKGEYVPVIGAFHGAIDWEGNGSIGGFCD